MRERLRIFLYLTIFWLIFMVCARLAFMGYNYDFTSSLTHLEKLLSMLHGLQMDASMTGYFLAASGLLLSLSALKNKLWIGRTLSILTIIFLFLSIMVVVIDVELYRHWGFRMNTTPFMYLGSAAMGSINSWVIIKIGVLFILFLTVFVYVFVRKIYPRIEYLGEAKSKDALFLLLLTCLLFIPIRGSFTVAPMNTGFVYFHNDKPYANHAAINVIWNFLNSLRKSANLKYPENFYDANETHTLFNALYPKNDSTIRLFKVDKPNIILVILESFTADLIEPLGGIKDLTPNLNALCREGILFDQFYASGDRTDKGLISILSGYPAQPQSSIIKFPNKTQKLPQLASVLRKSGYHTSFVHGGDIDFANFRSYLNTSGFHHLTTLDDFDDDLYTSKWGVHDHYLFERAITELDTAVVPFFKVILTLSSHEPFDVPMKTYVAGDDDESMFLNSCHYTDKAIGSFIAQCKQKEWWKNTVVVITADHGHRHPGQKELQAKERFKIPLLMIGGTVNSDTVIHTLSNQTDIANTLLAQIDHEHPEFIFSKNIVGNNAVPFAAYFYDNGYGFLFPDKYMVYTNHGKRFMIEENVTEQDLNVSKAYQQKLYLDYNHRGRE